MDVLVALEGGHKVLVAAQVRHNAQLHLRIVGREEHTARLGYERLAYLLALLLAYRYVLEVRVA